MTLAQNSDAPPGYCELGGLEKEQLKAIFKDQVQFDVPMKRYTTMGVGGPADAVIMPGDISAIEQLFKWATEQQVPWYIVGGGSNLVVQDGGIRGVVLLLPPYFKGISAGDRSSGSVKVTVKAGTRLRTLCRTAIEEGWAGMSFAGGIPASVGGAIVMNAGTTEGCMADVLSSITVLRPDGSIQCVKRNELDFGYRRLVFPDFPADKMVHQTVILEAGFRLPLAEPADLAKKALALKKKRQLHQPEGVASAGCFFKNPTTGPSAGALIDKAGLKGKQVGGAQVSTHHANFIINRKRAQAADVLILAEYVQTRVTDLFGVCLEPEVVILGEAIDASKSI